MVFQVKGTACASSKNLRGRREVVEDRAGAFAKEVMVVPIGGIPCCVAEKDAAVLVSVRLVRERLSGECNEFMEVAGDTPFERYERRRRCYRMELRVSGETIGWCNAESACRQHDRTYA